MARALYLLAEFSTDVELLALSLNGEFTVAQVRTRWKTRIAKAHPDHGGSHELTRDLNVARDRLTNWLQSDKPSFPDEKPAAAAERKASTDRPKGKGSADAAARDKKPGDTEPPKGAAGDAGSSAGAARGDEDAAAAQARRQRDDAARKQREDAELRRQQAEAERQRTAQRTAQEAAAKTEAAKAEAERREAHRRAMAAEAAALKQREDAERRRQQAEAARAEAERHETNQRTMAAEAAAHAAALAKAATERHEARLKGIARENARRRQRFLIWLPFLPLVLLYRALPWVFRSLIVLWRVVVWLVYLPRNVARLVTRILSMIPVKRIAIVAVIGGAIYVWTHPDEFNTPATALVSKKLGDGYTDEEMVARAPPHAHWNPWRQRYDYW